MGRLLDQPGYGKFWIADTVSQFGSNVTAVALPALAILTMKANDVEVGVLRAAQWLPYLFFGLLAGVVVDRYPRKPILIGTDLARAVMLGLIPVLSPCRAAQCAAAGRDRGGLRRHVAGLRRGAPIILPSAGPRGSTHLSPRSDGAVPLAG